MWIVLLNQVDLPLALPTLDAPLTGERCFELVVRFLPHQLVDSVPGSKA
jgi:hypothetical protein